MGIESARVCTIIVLLMTTGACAVDGQVPTEVGSQEFFAGRVSGQAGLQEFVTHAGDRDQLKRAMGTPATESCDTTYVSVECTLSWWDGVSAYFMEMPNGMELVTLTLTGPAAFLDYGSATIRVGDPIERLRQIFPSAYDNRGHDCSTGEQEVESTQACSHAAIVVHDINGLMFEYDPGTLAIEAIEYTRHIF